MATAAFALLLLATLVALGRPSAPLTARALPGAALHGALVLTRLSDRRRERRLGRRDERPATVPSARDRVPAPR